MSRTVAALLALFAVCTAIANFSPADEPPKPAETAPMKGNFEPLGSVGCSATACHGKPDAKYLTEKPGEDCWKASATIFHAADPHTKAYEVLFNPLSQQIAAKLKTGIPAHEDERCLACHTNPTLAKKDVKESWKKLRSEGVSCEACHGNAEKWVAPHTVWNEKTNKSELSEIGFSDLSGRRAVITCMKCHIGSPGDADSPPRDMNHDMIAAGHPRLDYFDYPSLQSRMPQHWFADREMKEKWLQAGWAIEALANSEADAEPARIALSMDRFNRSKKGDTRTPWPELSESSCVNCHHTLKHERQLNVNPFFKKDARLLMFDLLMKPKDNPPNALFELSWEESRMAYRVLAAYENMRRNLGMPAVPEVEKDFLMLKSQLLDTRNYDQKVVAKAIENIAKRIQSDLEKAEKKK